MARTRLAAQGAAGWIARSKSSIPLCKRWSREVVETLLGQQVWTLSVWRDQASRMRFFMSEGHQRAIYMSQDAIESVRYKRIEVQRSESCWQLLVWADLRNVMRSTAIELNSSNLQRCRRGLRRYDLWVIKALILILISLMSLPPPTAQAQPLPTTQNKRMQACTTCHGAGATATVGRTANEVYFPRIAGKPAGYLFNQLKNFRDGRRHYGLMVGLVEHLNDAALLEMAQYFSQLDLPYPEPQAPPVGTSAQSMQRGQQLALTGDAAQGIPACVSCHGANLLGVQPAIPGLLGLPRDYMAAQVGAWQTRMRRAQAPDCMASVALRLSAEDVSAVSTWLAAQRVPVGGKPTASVARLPTPLPTACGGVN
jgi:cytochrome c553